MCPAAHPWVYRPKWKKYYDACCATEHATGNQYFMNSRTDLSTRGDNCIGGYAWCPTDGSIPCIDYAESTDGLPPTMVTTAGVAAPKFWQVVHNKFCANRPCSDGACAHSIRVKSAADCATAVAVNPTCGDGFSFGLGIDKNQDSTTGWCDCPPAGEECTDCLLYTSPSPRDRG